MYSSKFELIQEQRNIEVILSNRLDGMIIATALLNPENIKKIISAGLPVVTIEKFMQNSVIPCITIKNREISKKAVGYLIKLGHKRIGFISEPLEIGKIQNRLSGYKDALKDANIPFDDSLVFVDRILAEEIYDNCYNYIKNIFSVKRDLTAIFASTDVIAISAIRALSDLGFNVPDDISILGFDGLEITKYIRPSLTTIIQPRYEMGRQAMKLLLKVINGEKAENVELKANLVIRESTKEKKN